MLARRTVRVKAWQLRQSVAWGLEQAARAGFDSVVVACEPTGHRWRVLDQIAAGLGVRLVCVQPLLVGRARESEDFTRNKNDESDGHVNLLRLYLTRTRRTAGPLFRASINGHGGPLSYDAAHHRWQSYCAAAGVDLDIHQLRHAHATELINNGVSIETVRRRLGHASTQTTQLYTLLADRRRHRDPRRPPTP